jgi:glucosamine--fructose-6-phosphate aminotransferase (isomerizing)
MSVSVDFRAAIHAQPENLAAAAVAFEESLAGFDLARIRQGTLVFSGIGASAHALVPAVLALRASGRRAFAVSAAELPAASAARLGDAYVLVSQSGASVETLQALESLGGAPVVAVSARGDSPLARAADLWLPLGPLPDTPVATLSYTASLQALGMLCDALRGTGDGVGAVWSRLPALAADVLERARLPVEALAASFASVRALDAAGGGAAAASAGETALLGREALRLPATGMETREYLHGPLEAVSSEFGCVLFGRERERELAGTLASYGATVALVTDAADASGAGVIGLPRVPDLAAAVLQILPVQLLVERVAALRGLEIGALARHQPDTKVA